MYLPTTIVLSSQSSFEFDIASSSLEGRFESSENIDYAGQLTIRLTDGFSPEVGDSFQLFSHSSSTGEFESVVTEGGNPGDSFVLTYSPTAVTATYSN
ncbi:MAG: hypothetical protein AB8G18_09660 [Gammaproteobacteria bacterium]